MFPQEKAPINRLKESIQTGNIAKMYDALSLLACTIREDHPDISTVDWYRAIEKHVPGKIHEDTFRRLLEAGNHSCDEQEAVQAKFVYLLLNMKTALSASERFLGRPETDQDDVIDVAAMRVIESMPIVAKNQYPVSISVHNQVSHAVKTFIADSVGASFHIVDHKDFFEILELVRKEFVRHPLGLSKQEINDWADERATQYGFGPKEVRPFLRVQQERHLRGQTAVGNDDMVDEIFGRIQNDSVIQGIEGSEKITERNRKAVLFYFGCTDGEEHVFEETGQMLGVTRGRARQIVYKGLHQIRRDRELMKKIRG